MKPLKVLFILGSMEIGGVQSGVVNFAQNITPEQASFDVLVHTKKVGFHEAAFSDYGAIHRIPLHEGHSKAAAAFFLILNNLYFRIRLSHFLKKHRDYNAVHCKSMSYCAAAMEAARAAKIPVRISQSHVDQPRRMHPFFQWYFGWCARRIEKNATVKLAVSEDAAKYLFGAYGGRVIKNPTISLKRLDPNKYRSVPHKGIHLIQVGTFSRRKNQILSICILHEIRKRDPFAKLTLIGYSLDEPDYFGCMMSEIEKYGLRDFVTILPKDSDIPKELSEADYMLIPSLREGLPNVALEAQAMGVPCFLSDSVTRAADCGLCRFISLNHDAGYWAREILKYRKAHGTVKKYVDMSSWDNIGVCKEYLGIWSGGE